tara:strand:- start:2739 stop:3179 length:441 start_codon:yes stop_codon:yes gene_type:complete
MSYKSKYKPENPSKYVGNAANIICRSTWERKVCKYLDKNENVVQWASEELSIPYISPVDKKPHKYYPDFIAEIKEKDGNIQTYLIEVKPYKQTMPPKKKTKVTKTYRMNMKTYMINEAKWEAAEKLCADNDWKFKILTEKNIFRGK